MPWLNYHHLLYFWTVARSGSVAAACRELHLSQPAVSGQIRTLEQSLGEKLFVRAGRKLVLTDTGRLVFTYADQIFSLGRELVDAVQLRSGERPIRIVVGVADVVPKLVAQRLLAPVLRLPQPVHLVCRQDKAEALLGQLATQQLDLVLSDLPVPAGSRVRAYHHLLAETQVALYGTPELAARYRPGFPGSLDGAPMLLPTANTAVRRALDLAFDQLGVRPRVVAEIEDSALLKTIGETGPGLFPSALAVHRDVLRRYMVEHVGTLEGVQERYYAISAERRIKNPVVTAISKLAREQLFE